MSTVNEIRRKIKKLYETNPNIHVNVTISHPKLMIRNAPAVIVGVYSNIFRIVETNSGYPRCHSPQYADVLVRQIEIVELNRNGSAKESDNPAVHG